MINKKYTLEELYTINKECHKVIESFRKKYGGKRVSIPQLMQLVLRKKYNVKIPFRYKNQGLPEFWKLVKATHTMTDASARITEIKKLRNVGELK